MIDESESNDLVVHIEPQTSVGLHLGQSEDFVQINETGIDGDLISGSNSDQQIKQGCIFSEDASARTPRV